MALSAAATRPVSYIRESRDIMLAGNSYRSSLGTGMYSDWKELSLVMTVVAAVAGATAWMVAGTGSAGVGVIDW